MGFLPWPAQLLGKDKMHVSFGNWAAPKIKGFLVIPISTFWLEFFYFFDYETLI